MKKYAIKRILQLIPILFAITFLSYGMMRIAGSDVVTRKMENTGGVVSEAALDAAREELGLDKPFLTQYFVWLGKALHGEFGESWIVEIWETAMYQEFRSLILLYQNCRQPCFLRLLPFCLLLLFRFLWEFCLR